jgi:hypothetical protein
MVYKSPDSSESPLKISVNYPPPSDPRLHELKMDQVMFRRIANKVGLQSIPIAKTHYFLKIRDGFPIL